MFKKKDDIKTFIVIISVCVICLVIFLFISKKDNYDKLVDVDEYNVYFTNVNYVNDFIGKIANRDSNSVYDLLDKEYINKNSINVDNVLDKLNTYSIQSSFDVDNMYFVQIRDNFVYYVSGKIYENGYDMIKELVDDKFAVIISVDSGNKSYSIYPVSNNYKKIINNIKKVDISLNNNNGIKKSDLINKEQVCAIYLSDFTNIIFSDYEIAYNLLSDDMKKIYVSSDEYKNYIYDNFGLISTVADKCKLEDINEKRVYTVIDTNNNTYVFTENTIMNYEVDFYLDKNE